MLKQIDNEIKQLFSRNSNLSDELNINLNLRPQNLSFETYYKLANEYEKLTS